MGISENKDIIGLDLPVRDGSNGYCNLFLRYYSTLAQIIADSQQEETFRVNLMVNLMINSIPDDEYREKMVALKKQLIKEKISDAVKENGGKSIDYKDNDRAIMDASMEMVGEISGFIDLYMGTTKRIGVSVESVYKDGFYISDTDPDTIEDLI